MGRETSKALKWSLRTMAGISGALGVGFIIWAVIVQNPPVNALPMYVNLIFYLKVESSECSKRHVIFYCAEAWWFWVP